MTVEEITSTAGMIKAIAYAISRNDEDLIYRVDAHHMEHGDDICSFDERVAILVLLGTAQRAIAIAKQADK
jgi:hypothetical protein|tara:strand:+ start:274 stop:486 length:213 start_codon:yes stop_codon:yes gene_type:complete